MNIEDFKWTYTTEKFPDHIPGKIYWFWVNHNGSESLVKVISGNESTNQWQELGGGYCYYSEHIIAWQPMYVPSPPEL